jgi:hypothetical protein
MLPYVFVCEGYRCWSRTCVLGVSISVVYSCARSIDVGHVFVYKGHRCWSCVYVLRVSMFVLYL